MLGLKGLATGIGSLPYANTEDALDLIFKYLPQIPFWPQLPKRDFREGMVAQFIEGLPCLKLKDKGIVLDADDKEEALESFYQRIIDKDIEHFKISQDFAAGLYAFKKRLQGSPSLLKNIKHIKCQITGPFTFAASINDKEGRALLHNSEFMQVIRSGLIMKALWQIKFFEEFGKSIIIFVDEPYLGCFGSAFTPINRENVIAEAEEIKKQIEEITNKIAVRGKVLVGVHCCGNTDWSIFTDINSIDIISFDAFSYLDKLVLYSDDLQRFLQNRALCWGIVPTQEFKGEETVEVLVEKINKGIDALVKKGVDRQLIKRELFISPSCGLGTLDTAKVDKIFGLLSGLSGEICQKISKK